MSNGGNKSKRVVLVMVAVVVGLPFLAAFGMVLWFMAQSFVARGKRPEIERKLSNAEAKAVEMDARWQKAMAAAAALPVGPAICPAQDFRLSPRGALKKALGLEGANGPDLDLGMRKMASAEAAAGISNEMVVSRSELPAKKSPMSARAAHLIGAIRSELQSGREDPEQLSARADALVAASFWSRDLTVVVESEVAPRLSEGDAGTFESGAARGLVYVFDYQQDKIVCVAEFLSKNSAVVEFATSKGLENVYGKVAVADDLKVNILESAKHALYGTDSGAR